jgi:hypothetical protein
MSSSTRRARAVPINLAVLGTSFRHFQSGSSSKWFIFHYSFLSQRLHRHSESPSMQLACHFSRH